MTNASITVGTEYSPDDPRNMVVIDAPTVPARAPRPANSAGVALGVKHLLKRHNVHAVEIAQLLESVLLSVRQIIGAPLLAKFIRMRCCVGSVGRPTTPPTRFAIRGTVRTHIGELSGAALCYHQKPRPHFSGPPLSIRRIVRRRDLTSLLLPLLELVEVSEAGALLRLFVLRSLEVRQLARLFLRRALYRAVAVR